MNDKSSNNQMEETFKLLQEIRKVNAPDDLLNKINHKISNNHVVPKLWIRAAAVVFICLVIANYYGYSNTSSESTSEVYELVSLPNNQLYHE